MYTPTDKQMQQISNNFVYHAPKEGQQDMYIRLREEARKLAISLCECAPESRELSLAITNLEQAIFWANAAIARNE